LCDTSRAPPLSAARFEEIFQSVVSKNMEELDKDEPKDMNRMGSMNNQHGGQQRIIVSGSHQIPSQQQVVIAQPGSQNSVYHQDGQTYTLYQPPQGQHVSQQPQRIIVQQPVPAQQMNRI